MKHLIRVFISNVFALWLTSQLISALVMPGGWQIVLFAGFVLSILMLIVAPILRILFIPINILTFGLLSWFVNVIVLFLLTVFVPEIRVIPWVFSGIHWSGFVVPSVHLSYFLSLIVVSLVISAITNIFHWTSEE